MMPLQQKIEAALAEMSGAKALLIAHPEDRIDIEVLAELFQLAPIVLSEGRQRGYVLVTTDQEARVVKVDG